MLEANTEESVGAADAINLVVLPRNPRMEETTEEGKEEEGLTETQQPTPRYQYTSSTISSILSRGVTVIIIIVIIVKMMHPFLGS